MEKTRVSSVIHKQFFGTMIVMTMMELAQAASSLVDATVVYGGHRRYDTLHYF